MPWTTNDKARIIFYGAYDLGPVREVTTQDLSDLVQDQLDALTDESLITRVQADLTKMDTLDALRTTEQGSANAALIRADVIEWEGSGARTTGILNEFETLRQRVARIISQRLTLGNMGWTSQVYRG